MNYNFHTHTQRCRHASGSNEDYINAAIEAGITHLGFSDHIPFIFPDGYDSGYRIPMDEAESYVCELSSLRKKYQNKIEISIGYEMEYYSEHFIEMLKIARNSGAEYLILGHHFILGEHPSGIGAGGPTDSAELLHTYVDEVIEAMKTGVFSYVAHPDFTCFTGDDNIYEKEIMRLALASKELDIPLEINLLGVRYGKFYPADKFWRVVGMIGSPVTVGYDAHNATDLLNKDQLRTAEEIIRRHGLNYVGAPRLRKI